MMRRVTPRHPRRTTNSPAAFLDTRRTALLHRQSAVFRRDNSMALPRTESVKIIDQAERERLFAVRGRELRGAKRASTGRIDASDANQPHWHFFFFLATPHRLAEKVARLQSRAETLARPRRDSRTYMRGDLMQDVLIALAI